jgi:hypothetical protein
MNSILRHLFAPAMVVVLATGCTAKGYELSETAALSTRRLKDSIATFQTRSDAAIAALDALAAEPVADLPGRFAKFTTEVNAVGSASQLLKRSVGQMRGSAEARFRAWDAENRTFTSADVRAVSEKRRAEVQEAYDKASSANDGGVEQAAAFSNDLANLRKLLSLDLSKAGIDSVSDLAKTVRKDHERMTEYGRAWSQQLDGAVEAFSAGSVAPAK